MKTLPDDHEIHLSTNGSFVSATTCPECLNRATTAPGWAVQHVCKLSDLAGEFREHLDKLGYAYMPARHAFRGNPHLGDLLDPCGYYWLDHRSPNRCPMTQLAYGLTH